MKKSLLGIFLMAILSVLSLGNNVLNAQTNLALGQPVTASSVRTYVAADAVDGNATTRWSSSYDEPEWIYVDLGQTYSINQVVINWETAYGTGYEIQVSDNAISWTTIYSTSTGDGGIDDLTGLSGSGRYVRMYGITRATHWGFSIWEFEVYGTDISTIPVTGVSVAPTSLTLEVSETSDLTETVSPSNATDLSVTWSSNNTSVATVNANGLVTAVAAGNATITVTTNDGSFTANCAVTVNAVVVPVTGVSVAPTSLTLEVSQTSDLTEAVSPSNATDKSVTWTSSNSSVATVNSSGLVTAVAAGNTTITVTTNDGSFTANCAVTVNAPSAGVTSSTTWQTNTVSTQNGLFTATFSATPNNNNMDGVTGILNGTATSYGSLACIIRFNTSGQIDARNGGTYAATNTINYSAGTSYAFRVVINVATHMYSVYVTPAGGSELTVASNFAFRSEQSAVSQVTGWALYAATGTHTVNSVVFTPAPPDTEAPSAPTGLTSGAVSAFSITLSWNASTDNQGVAGYNIYGGTSVVTASGTSANVNGLAPSTNYTFTVKAFDAAGNESVASNSHSVTTTEDNTGDWPTLATTGPKGTLTPYSGEIVTSSDGQVIENLNISGGIVVNHQNVTIRNCKFTALSIQTYTPTTGLNCVVEDSELGWAGRQNFTLRRCFMTVRSEDLIRIGGPNVTIEDCYLWITGPRDDGDHSDIIQEHPDYTAVNCTINHNTMYNELNATSCIISKSPLVVTNNLMAGGSYIMYINNSYIADNHFSTIFFPNGGRYGVTSGTGNTCVGNVWHESGLPLNCTSSAEVVEFAQAIQQDVKVYPNPLNGSILNIQLTGYEVNEVNVKITDLTGRTIYNQLHTVQSQLELPLDALSKGIYVVSVVGEGINNQQKLVVE